MFSNSVGSVGRDLPPESWRSSGLPLTGQTSPFTSYQFPPRNMPAFRACVHFLMKQSMIQSFQSVVAELLMSRAHMTQSTTEKEFTPQSIPKTILFIDGKTKVANVTQALIDRLVLKEFHSFTSSHNKDKVLDEFRKADSNIRTQQLLG